MTLNPHRVVIFLAVPVMVGVGVVAVSELASMVAWGLPAAVTVRAFEARDATVKPLFR